MDPIIATYIDLIKAKNRSIKQFFQGEPLRIAASMLPCVFISKVSTTVSPINNAEDQHQIGLRVTVITDVRHDLSTDDSNPPIVEGVSSLYEIMEGREDDYTLKETSILDILRSNINLDVAHNLRTDLSTVPRVDYGMTLQDRAREEWRIEARLDFTATFIQVR